jgi:AcrR family transcriptional regulator
MARRRRVKLNEGDFPPNGKGAKRKRRPRRSTEEIVNLIIAAACEEFERNGYEGAKTAEIARKAGVAEALIFSNFGSKAKLFHDSIFNPLNRHFLEFSASHRISPDDAVAFEEGTRQYILEIQQFIQQHSRMLASVVAAQMYETDDLQGVRQIEGLHDYFSRATANAMNRNVVKPRVDPRLMARVSFASILACTIFKDWLFPRDLASDAQITNAIRDFVMEGLSANASAPSGSQPPGRPRRASKVKGSAKKG